MNTVEFEQVNDDRYGGKAAGLAELIRLGRCAPATASAWTATAAW